MPSFLASMQGAVGAAAAGGAGLFERPGSTDQLVATDQLVSTEWSLTDDGALLWKLEELRYKLATRPAADATASEDSDYDPTAAAEALRLHKLLDLAITPKFCGFEGKHCAKRPYMLERCSDCPQLYCDATCLNKDREAQGRGRQVLRWRL